MMSKAQDIRNAVIDANVRDERNHTIYLAVLAVIKARVGQKITKRVATAIEKALPDYVVHYCRETRGGHVYGTKITIWGGGIDFSDALRFGLGAQDCIDVAVFEDKNICYGSAAAERINERRVWLGDEQKAYDIVSAYHILCDAQEQFEREVERNGCDASKDDIEKALGIID